MIDHLLTTLRQPEYVHVLINPLPVYGLVVGIIGLVVALFLRQRSAQIVALVVVFAAGLSAWPAAYFGEQAYDIVYSQSDEAGDAWLDEHRDRAEDLVWCFYALAAVAAAAIAIPRKWPRMSGPLMVATLVLALVSLGAGGYIAYAGGRIRHREFRYEAPPKKISHEQRH